MPTELRKTGIGVVGDIPWGTHFCHFYETTEDLLDTVVPYFKAGLESKEFCVWLSPESLTEQEARNALERAVPDLDCYLTDRSIEILRAREWYFQGGTFDLKRVTSRWREKLAHALAKGYAGMRVSGNAAWLEKKDWKDFYEYEQELSTAISNQPMTVLCTSPLTASSAAEILDVTRAHQLAIARRHGAWEVVETPELKQAKAEIKRLNEELEQRVVERTRELTATNEALRREITEHKLTEEALRKERSFVSALLDTADALIVILDAHGRVVRFNRACERLSGYSSTEVRDQYVWDLTFLSEEMKPVAKTLWEKLHEDQFPLQRENDWVTKDGKHRSISWSNTALLNDRGQTEYIVGIGIDITQRKRAEETLQATSEQLRALSARLNSAQEEEGARIARELHDELGSALTGLKWELESIEKLCAVAATQRDSAALRDKIDGAMDLIDTTLNAVRRISAELRPSLLDDLGLVAAIEWQAQQFTARTAISCQCDAVVDTIDVSREQATAIFRIFQEALTNILRHAQATRVNILIEEEEGELVLEVRDNGRGITEEESNGARSLGLIGMRERAQLVGGRIEITGVAGKGTVLSIRVPLAGQAAD